MTLLHQISPRMQTYLYQHAQLCFSNFMLLSDLEKSCVIMLKSNLAYITAKTCFYILQHKEWLVYFYVI